MGMRGWNKLVQLTGILGRKRNGWQITVPSRNFFVYWKGSRDSGSNATSKKKAKDS
jgi:hypothetical protein